ncbi:MAG: 2-oxo acid dehydrogenase subunit E2 [Nitrospira sp.]|jgi:pyruvate dehydrogenase E2 component (dihydrolipoamide acetyltransferase)|nr:2-oxo acid dehydrogenase subunit E2 [Nitrospira sp.]
MAEFLMPTLGADMTDGTLVQWKKKEGDRITKGEIIAEVDTEKAAIDVESHTTGIIERLITKPGDKVPVGTVMAIIREEGRPTASVVSPQTVTTPPTPPPPVHRTESGTVAPSQAGRLRMSPAARKLAAERGIDASRLQGTGPEGAITLEDIERATTATADIAKPVGAADRQARMRQTIAAAMTRSKREIPHYYLSTTIDMGRAITWLKDSNEQRPVTERLLYGVLLIKAVALALRRVPELNALWKDGEARRSERIHIGTAISLRQGGLVAPALHDADRLSLSELMQNFQDLVKRARAGSLRSSELSDPTITVTSLGEQGVETVFGVIYPPQVALVGFGKVVERPWVADGLVVPRPVLMASLSADHRVTDGHRGGLFLAEIDRLLQEPQSL